MKEKRERAREQGDILNHSVRLKSFFIFLARKVWRQIRSSNVRSSNTISSKVILKFDLRGKASSG